MPKLLRACVLASLLSAASVHADSVCYGKPGAGRPEGGVRIPVSGANFGPYSHIGVTLGRTYVHAKVAAGIESSFTALETAAPGVRYIYGESGWAAGGRLKPHRTHQNGLAVDFMVPVRNADGKSVPLPTGITNKYGYAIEFDAQGRHGELTIDFEAIAAHLRALVIAGEANGVGIARVIFDTAYLPRLFATPDGAWLKANVPFMQGEPWIRHDEHYHVDFAVACKPLQAKG